MKSVAKLFSLLKQRIIGGTNVPYFIPLPFGGVILFVGSFFFGYLYRLLA